MKRRLEAFAYRLLTPLATFFMPPRQMISPAPRRILMVLRGQRLGDAVVSFPFSNALKQAFPEAAIWSVAPRSLSGILACDRNVDHVCSMPESERRHAIQTLQRWSLLRGQQFDAAFVLGIPFISNLMGRVVSRQAIGYNYNGRGCVLDIAMAPHVSCNRSGWEYDHHSNPTHVTEFWDRLIHTITDVRTPISWEGLDLTPHRQVARQFLKKHTGGSGPLVVLHPWAGSEVRSWPSIQAKELIALAVDGKDCRVILTGGPLDAEGCRALAEGWGGNVQSAAGTLSPPQTWALLDEADLVISVDTCIIHMAAALGKPVISLFGAGDPLVWGPHGQSERVIQVHRICQRCKRSACLFPGVPCMSAITARMVWEKAASLL